MTSDNRRDNDHYLFSSKTPHFFKVILAETIRDGKLGVPRKFVRKYGKQLPSSIKLEVPGGTIWQVELTKSDEAVWLQKGWKEFAEHYSVKFGHFLVFRYEGNAHFHVLIFDKSALEIEYPCTSIEDGDDLSVEICEDVLASRKSKEKSHLSCLRPHKKIRVDSPKIDGVLSPATKKGGGITVNTEVFCCMRKLTATEKAHAAQTIQRFCAFRTTENPVFMVLIKPSAVRYKCQMSIPSAFAGKFITMLKGIMTLCDSTGKTWSVKFYRKSENQWSQAQIHGGWRAFAVDNNLDVGDICFFELIKHPEMILKVFIYPAVENANRPPADENIASRVRNRRLATSRELNEPKIKGNENVESDIEILDDFALNLKTKKELPSPGFHPCKMMRTNPSCIRASAFKSTNPSFTVQMWPSYVRGGWGPNIPLHFARRYFKKNGEVTLRGSDGRTWSVDYKMNSRCKFLSKSWRAFVLDNSLKVGDVCVFELIDENERFLEVHFFSF